jgi:hypothetical protein
VLVVNAGAARPSRYTQPTSAQEGSTGVIAQLRLEVNGPGVGAHDTLDAVMHRLLV